MRFCGGGTKAFLLGIRAASLLFSQQVSSLKQEEPPGFFRQAQRVAQGKINLFLLHGRLFVCLTPRSFSRLHHYEVYYII